MPRIGQNDQHVDYSCQKGARFVQKIRARRELVFRPQFGCVPVVTRPSGENFPVLLINSNRLVKKNFRFRYRASDIIPTYHFFSICVESGYLMKRYQDPKQDLNLVGGRGEII